MYNRCILDQKPDDKNGNHPVDIGKDTDTDAKHEVPEVQRIADMCIGALPSRDRGRHLMSEFSLNRRHIPLPKYEATHPGQSTDCRIQVGKVQGGIRKSERE